MIEVIKNKTSVWVLQPRLKIELKDHDNSSSVGEANALAKALPNVKIIGSIIVPIERISPKEFFGAGKVNELSIFSKIALIIGMVLGRLEILVALSLVTFGLNKV